MLAARVLASFTLAGEASGGSSNADAPAGKLTLAGQTLDAWATRRLPPAAGMLGVGALASFPLAGRGAVAATFHADVAVGRLTLAGRVSDRWVSRLNRDAPRGTLVLRVLGTVSQPVAPSIVDQAPGLIRTAMPGTPGLVQPGYFCTGIAIWRGPFDTEVAFGFTPGAVPAVSRGQQLTVAPNVASQFAASDATWWEFH